MTTPYALTVTSLTGDPWSYSWEHEQPVDPNAPTMLADSFAYSWGFNDEQIPGRLTPSTTTFSLWSTSAAAMPSPQQGDLVDVTLRLGVGGALMVRCVGRITDAVVQLVPASKRPARLTVTVTDLLADLASRFPVRPRGSFARRASRWGLLSYALGLSIGCPVGMDRSMPLLAIEWGDDSAESIAATLCASHAPGGVHHTLTPYYGPGYPPGYEWVDTGIVASSPLPDPESTVKYLLAPASRYMPTAPPQPTLSAAYCQVPATARRGREHLINTARISGVWQAADNTIDGADLEKSGQTTEISSADAATRGPLGRDIPTQLVLRLFDQADPDVPLGADVEPAVRLAAAVHLSDPTALAAAWTFDEFTVLSYATPPPIAAEILPQLVPHYPGDGDGRLIRHLTVTNLPPHARLTADATVRGFITKGTVAISGGKLTHTLTTTPGNPTGNPHT